VSMTVDEARQKLSAIGLKLVVGQQTESDTIPANVILSQEPGPDSPADPSGTVTVMVSTGPAAVEVPDVVNEDPEAAQSALRDAGLNVVRAYMVEAANPTGKVMLQDPPAKSRVKKGTRVTLRISVSGSVPDVRGMPIGEAKAALTQQGYQIGNIAYTQDSSLQDGQVVRTEPEANSQLKPGEVVVLYVQRSGQ
jgi:beta-lactam-binding protein with PASTA domain